MFRILNKSTLLLLSLIIFIFNSIICVADVSTFQNGLSTTNVIQKPGDYYTDPSMPTPNLAIFPPPPPKSSYLPTQPFFPVRSNQFMPTQQEAQQLLSGYRNPSLPTPNPALYPPPPPPTQLASNKTTTTTTTTQTTTTGNNQGAGAGSTSTSTTTQNGSGGSTSASTTTPQSSAPSNNMTDLQNCVPGTYAFPSPVKTITTSTYYGSTTANNPPPLMTYSVSGMQNGKCVVSITQSAVTPPSVQNGSFAPSHTAAPAANISTCNLSPNDLATLVGQTQKAQMGGYYGNTTIGSNYYTQQSLTNACSSYLVVNGAAVPYKSFP